MSVLRDARARGLLDASLSRRFAVVLLALLIPIAMVAASIRHGLFSNARDLIDALRVGALAEKSLVLVLTQDDVTKELFLDPSSIGLAERKIAAYDENLAILAELRRLSVWPELTNIVDRMVALEASLRPLDTEILETLLSGDAARARELYFGDYRRKRDAFERLSVALAALSKELAAQAEARMLERNRATVLQVVAALLLGMAAVAGLIVRLSRRLAARTAGMLAVLEDVADGDLRRTPADASRDELGRIATALGRAIEGMRATILQVAESLDRVGDGTREIHRLAQEVGDAAAAQIAGIDLATGAMSSVTAETEGLGLSADVLAESASDSSSAVEKLRAGSEELRANGETLGQVVDGVSGAVSQMLQNLEQVMQRTEELARAAVSTTAGSHRLAHSFSTIDKHAAETERRSREVVSVVERGREDMERTIIGMAAIREATDEADEAIAVLMKRAGEIDKIVDVITGVGDQTSLLALNAAILATRAGEHGKGFSVVAGEIKTLAASVLTHTREVTLRIDAVQDQAARVAEAIKRGSQRVREGVEVSREAGENFAAIQAAAHESGERMKQVADAVRKESESVERMVELASTLDSTVAEIRRALGEQRRGAGALRDAAGETTQIADLLRRRADAQSRDTRAIADGVEKVRHSGEQIRSAVRDQRRSCARTGTTLERVAEGGHNNEESARSVRDRLATLEGEADELRARTRWFKT